jgi:hypothetical protein
MKSYTSIYIPRVFTRHTETSIKNIMSSGIRVVFTPINKYLIKYLIIYLIINLIKY